MNSRARSSNLEKIYRCSNRITNSREHVLLMLFIEQSRGTLVDKSRSSRIENLRVRLNKLSFKRREEIMRLYSNMERRKPSPSPRRRRRRRNRQQQPPPPPPPLQLPDSDDPLPESEEDTTSKSESPEVSREPSPIPKRSTPSPLPELKIIAIDIQPDKTNVHMVPVSADEDKSNENEDEDEDEEEEEEEEEEDDENEDDDIIYPDGIEDFHPYKIVARYRRAVNESTNFRDSPIKVGEDSVETLVLGLDAFAQQHDSELKFRGTEKKFNKSIYRAALGEIDLGSIHLLATDLIKTANFQFEINLDYDEEITQSKENVEQFVADFCQAVSNVLSCDNNSVRVFSIDKISKKSGKSHVNFGLTTPDPKKTERLARKLQTEAKSGFGSDTILKHVKQSEYDITWKSVITYLKIRPSDLNPLYNFDYRLPGTPEQDTRGSCPYYLPIGWYRFALNVDDKFADGKCWLGRKNLEGEWPVAFHGTCAEAVTGIVQHGLLSNAVKVDAMRSEAIAKIGDEANKPGLYVATHCNGGSDLYTRPFTVTTFPGKSEQFRIVFQCRVQPGKYTTHTGPVKKGEAWRIVDPQAVRPYGILLKKEVST